MGKTQLHIRIPVGYKLLIERIANKLNMSVTDFIISVLIPYCVKLDK